MSSRHLGANLCLAFHSMTFLLANDFEMKIGAELGSFSYFLSLQDLVPRVLATLKDLILRLWLSHL